MEYCDSLAPDFWTSAGSGNVLLEGHSQTVRAVTPEGSAGHRPLRSPPRRHPHRRLFHHPRRKSRPPPGTSYTLINKTTPGAITDTFTGKPEDSTFTASGYDWHITYIGGIDNNDTILTIPVPTALSAIETWHQLHFGTTENSGNAADTFDSNSDGETNLLEFATGQNPNAATRAQIQMVLLAGQVQFTYTRNKAAFDAGYLFIVEYSDTLAAPWTSAGSGSIITDGPQETLKAIVPAGSADSRFIRLKITKP